jgi:hypothetical protein
MTSIQIGDKIYASDPITGWRHYMRSQTILHKVIENGDVTSAIHYGAQPELIDAETCLEITPLFMMLQYSIVTDFSEAIKVLVDKKLQVNPSFERFFKNIILAKNYGDAYVERLMNKLNKSIGDEKYKQITKDINY